MRKKIVDWLKNPVLTETDLFVLRFAPRAIVFGLQCSGLNLKEQHAVLSAILSKHGKEMDSKRHNYLESQVNALGQICLV